MRNRFGRLSNLGVERQMKTGNQRELEASFLAKVPLDSRIKRLIWWAFRRYLLNEDHYRVIQRFTGPRPRGTNQASTVLDNATHRRIYVEVRRKPRRATNFEMRLVPPRVPNTKHIAC